MYGTDYLEWQESGKMASDWRPIADAPRDQTKMLVFMPDSDNQTLGNVQVGSCGMSGNGHEMWVVGGHFAFDIGTPTHWMPLPSPPEDTP